MSGGEMTQLDTTDKQTLLLRRYWELLEGLKQQRNQLPIVVGTALLAATAFVLDSSRIPSSRPQAVGISVLILLIAGTGVAVGRILENRYEFVNNRIKHLYRRIGITGEDFFPDEGSPLDSAKAIFVAVYIVIVVIGVICALGVALAPLTIPSPPGLAR